METLIEKKITIIIPAYNESKRILQTLNNIDEYIDSCSANLFQVIVVNDGSTDSTEGVVKNWIENKSKNKCCFQIISYMPNKGKGCAINQGFLKASNPLVLYTDADGASPIEEIKKLLYWIDRGFDVVIGSRMLKDSDSEIEMSFIRKVTGRIFHMILSFLGLAEFRDTQCGFKLFKLEVAKKLAENQQCYGFSFDIEYLFLLKKLGYKTKEVPINWYHVHGSKVSLFRDSIKMLVEVLKIRFLNKYNINN